MRLDEFFDYFNDFYYYDNEFYEGDYDDNSTAVPSYNFTTPPRPDILPTIDMWSDLIFYIAMLLGIPGAVLSAIGWLRVHVGGADNSSVLYLVALALNDQIYLLFHAINMNIHLVHCDTDDSACFGEMWVKKSASVFEPLAVLGFSSDRLIALLHPLQAPVCCTASRAKKVLILMALIALISQAVNVTCVVLADTDTLDHVILICFFIIVPLSIVVINVRIICYQRHRSATNPDAVLVSGGGSTGVLEGSGTHQQSIVSVPTLMLNITAIIFAIICLLASVVQALFVFTDWETLSMPSWVVLYQWFAITSAVFSLAYAYKFFIYIITGKRFRSELHQVSRRCRVHF